MSDNDGLALLTTAPDACSLIRNGLRITPDVTFEQWAAIGRSLDALGRSLQFAVGDWINFGENHYGEMYSQAVEFTTYDYHSLINLAAVARRVPMSLRKDELSYSHHAAVAYLNNSETQVQLLDEADQNDWTVRQLRARVREEQHNPNPNGSTAAGRTCPNCGWELE